MVQLLLENHVQSLSVGKYYINLVIQLGGERFWEKLEGSRWQFYDKKAFQSKVIHLLNGGGGYPK